MRCAERKSVVVSRCQSMLASPSISHSHHHHGRIHSILRPDTLTLTAEELHREDHVLVVKDVNLGQKASGELVAEDGTSFVVDGNLLPHASARDGEAARSEHLIAISAIGAMRFSGVVGWGGKAAGFSWRMKNVWACHGRKASS